MPENQNSFEEKLQKFLTLPPINLFGLGTKEPDQSGGLWQ